MEMSMKLEIVTLPVRDVDAAKRFYVEKLGFRLDKDHVANEHLRFVQLTPPGSSCSIAIGTGLSAMQSGSLDGLQVIVKNVRKMREILLARGVSVGDIYEFPWGTFAYFTDLDGNHWGMQQMPPRRRRVN